MVQALEQEGFGFFFLHTDLAAPGAFRAVILHVRVRLRLWVLELKNVGHRLYALDFETPLLDKQVKSFSDFSKRLADVGVNMSSVKTKRLHMKLESLDASIATWYVDGAEPIEIRPRKTDDADASGSENIDAMAADSDCHTVCSDSESSCSEMVEDASCDKLSPTHVQKDVDDDGGSPADHADRLSPGVSP